MLPLTVVTVLLTLLIAALAGGSLFVLRQLNDESAHQVAAQSMVERGQAISRQLSEQDVVGAGTAADPRWQNFSRLAGAIHSIDSHLEYVAVTEDGSTIYQDSVALGALNKLDGTDSSKNKVVLGRKLLRTTQGEQQVLTFSTPTLGPNGRLRIVEIGLRREALESEERASAKAISSMFRFSMATLCIAFGSVIVIVAWLMHREAIRDTHRREEEHLAFSGVMANGIVHDFRNPMSSLRLDVQMLGRESKRGTEVRLERIGELSERVRHTLDRMDKVFQEFLYLSKPQRETVDCLNLLDVVNECLELVTPRVERARITLSRKMSDEQIFIHALGSAFRRGFVNILINAVHFAGDEGRITVELKRVGDRVRLCVADSGPGVPKNKREKIFEMFESTRPQGTGLGLFFARNAIEKSGGTVGVSDAREGGACFTIEFPVARKDIPKGVS